MGIRINKVLGYGLTDLKFNKKTRKVDDPRIVPGSLSYDSCEERYKEFNNWIRESTGAHDTAIQWLMEGNFATEIYRQGFNYEVRRIAAHETSCPQPIHHDYCYGDPKVLVFQSLDQPDHYRRDNDIDACEGLRPPYVTKLLSSSGIYPHMGFVCMDRAAQAEAIKKWPELDFLNRREISPSDYNIMVGRWDKKQKATASGEMLEFLLNNYRPTINPSIMILTRCLGIFVDWQKTVQELRPMIYTYWS